MVLSVSPVLAVLAVLDGIAGSSGAPVLVGLAAFSAKVMQAQLCDYVRTYVRT